MSATQTSAAVALKAASDVELVRLAQQHDGDAFRLIMERNNQRLFRLVRSVLRDDTEAEDVVQETYVRAAAHLSDFRGDARLSTWLSRIALNEALMRLRRRRPTAPVDAIDDAVHRQDAEIIMFPGLSASTDPERDAARAEVRRLIERAVDRLPESYRLVFVLRDIEGLSVEETARHLDVAPITVRTRLFRARLLLRKFLDKSLRAALTDSFPFAGERCRRLTERVLAETGFSDRRSR